MDTDFFNIIVIIGIVISLVLVQILLRSKHPVWATFKNILAGIITLFAVNLTSSVTAVTVPISLLSLGVSAVAGIPGVTLLLALNLV